MLNAFDERRLVATPAIHLRAPPFARRAGNGVDDEGQRMGDRGSADLRRLVTSRHPSVCSLIPLFVTEWHTGAAKDE